MMSLSYLLGIVVIVSVVTYIAEGGYKY